MTSALRPPTRWVPWLRCSGRGRARFAAITQRVQWRQTASSAIPDENHDLSNIFGDGSPIARLYDLDGYVLLVGVGYDKNTSLHLADARAQYPGKHDCVEHSAIVENGRRIWKEYRTLFVDGEDFDEIGAAFERECSVRTAPLGNGIIRFMRQRELVDFAVGWIERHRGRLE